MEMKDTLVKEVKERAELSRALNYLRFAITAFCLFNSTYICVFIRNFSESPNVTIPRSALDFGLAWLGW